MNENGTYLRISLVLLVVLCATGCSTMPREAETVEAEVLADISSEVVSEPVRRPHPDEYPVANFDKDMLYELLVAEVAGYRGQYETALEKYVAMTIESRDPGVAARATVLAAYLRRSSAALTVAQIWAEVDPDNIDAHRYAADQLMGAGDLERAILHMEEIKRLGGLADFETFAYRAKNLDDEARGILLLAMARMLEKYPDDENLLFSKAVLLEQNGDYEEALQIADTLLVGKKNINVIILKLNALKDQLRNEEAVTFLSDMLVELPENRRLRLIYARFLFETRDLDGSRLQYKLVLAKSPNDGDVLFALALIGMEQKNDEAAAEYLSEMIRWNRRVGEAHFYLGSIAERKNDVVAAVREYKQAGTGYEFLPAQSRIAAILVDQGRIREARDFLSRRRAEFPNRRPQLIMVEAQLLSERGLETEVFDTLDNSISEDPKNIELLYFRAMTGEKFNRMDILERDLRAIIDIDPTNADALNALGYTLTDRTDRHEEALALIERALTIRPEEAAFIDSMGWVLYRLQNFEKAVAHLRRALELFPNDEVAAHLGEVLWKMGEQLEANNVWNKALEMAPDSDILKRIIQQFTAQ